MLNLFPLKIGVMQGRLLPKVNGRYQAFPQDDWEKEFKIASNLGLSFIEFIFDKGNIYKNPLMNKNELKKIRIIEKETNVKVKSVCADYFMYNSFFEVSEEIFKNRKKILEHLILNCAAIGIKKIVLPCVDKSSIKNNLNRIKVLSKIIDELKPTLINKDVLICLETDLDPKSFKKFLISTNCKNVKVNYDLGNSAALGYKTEEEFDNYGEFISDIHIKDRLINGESVILGSGSANFEIFFTCLKKLNRNKYILIMQSYRDEEGINVFKSQLNWFIKEYKFFVE